MLRELLLLALRNMRRQVRRTILTALTFAVAVFLYTVLVAVPVSMDRIAEEAAKGLRLITIAHNSYRLPAKYCNDIRKMPHVVACAPEIQFTTIYRDPRTFITTFGVTQDIYNITGDADFHPSPEQVKMMNSDRRFCAVGSVLMKEQGWKPGEQITLRDPSNDKLKLTLIPMLELPGLLTARTLMFDRRMFDNAVKDAFGADTTDRASFLSVKVDDPKNMDQVTAQIDENFHNSDAETETTPESDALASVVTGIGDIKTIMYSLCLVVLITVLLIAANSMAMMVRDRVAEVAVMRALGFDRIHVAALLLAEAGLIGLIGGAVGAGAALWKFHAGISLGTLTGGIGYMAVTPDTAAMAVLIALGVSML
ncbi:MAG TPA: FtsX-like permease family protein, partial [Candidatus Binataceae bacterium]|nr:FtsX-like permease family protein [Candidatus Binataceae bacterium]